jgi:hypothetical protein
VSLLLRVQNFPISINYTGHFLDLVFDQKKTAKLRRHVKKVSVMVFGQFGYDMVQNLHSGICVLFNDIFETFFYLFMYTSFAPFLFALVRTRK